MYVGISVNYLSTSDVAEHCGNPPQIPDVIAHAHCPWYMVQVYEAVTSGSYYSSSPECGQYYVSSNIDFYLDNEAQGTCCLLLVVLVYLLGRSLSPHIPRTALTRKDRPRHACATDVLVLESVAPKLFQPRYLLPCVCFTTLTHT